MHSKLKGKYERELRKRLYGMLVVIMLLTLVTSSLTLPISGSDMQCFGSSSSKTMSNAESLETIIMENVTIFENSSCQLQLLMTMLDSSLSQVFRDFLGFAADKPVPENIPELVNFSDIVTIGSDVREYIAHSRRAHDNRSSVNVKDELVNGTIQEHLHSFGITITPENITGAKTWGTNRACIVNITATGLVQSVPGEVAIGPLNLNRSFDRAGFILNKIGQIQQMLESFSGTQTYDTTWDTTFSLPNQLTNQPELTGKTWSQDFGNGTRLDAELTVTGPDKVRLVETMLVTEKRISVTPEELLEDRFLCYKVFHMRYNTGGGKSTSNPQSTYLQGTARTKIDSGLDPTWSVDLLDEEFSLPIINGPVDVTLVVRHRLTLSVHVSWKWKWFRLKEFKTYTQLGVSTKMELQVRFHEELDLELEKLLVERDMRRFFMVGFIPVLVDIEFSATAYLNVHAEANVEVTFPANATGSIKAGVGWKRNKGWYPIRGAKMDVETGDPTLDTNAMVTITPSVAFRLALIFYETAGPFIELEPYAELMIWTVESGIDYRIELGVNVNAGIQFGDKLAIILGLDDWGWPVFNYVLWEYPEPEEHDVAVTDIRASEKAFVTETVEVHVDVLNKGDNTENVNVQLFYRKEDSGSWNLINFTDIYNMEKGNLTTTVFNWPTSTIGWNPGNYTLNATATITQDDIPEDNHRKDWIWLEVQNVRITSVTAFPSNVFNGQSVQITVTVENNGTVSVPSLPVFAFYNGNLISDVRCECMLMVFNFPPAHSAVLEFKWDTINVPGGLYQTSANTTLLPHEIYNDNSRDGDYVTVWGPPPGTYNVDISVTDVSIVSAQPIAKGETVHINVTVEHSGSNDTAFYVTVYANTTMKVQTRVVNLTANGSGTVTFTWNTIGKEARGNYTISAYAHPLPYETVTTNNAGVAPGIVTILYHDVCIMNIFPFKTVVCQGYSMSINVTVKNQGDYTETFNVTIYAEMRTRTRAIYADINVIDTFTDITLQSGDSITITFVKAFGFPRRGVYTICAYATQVPYDWDTDDNTYTGGTVRVNMVGDLNSDNRVSITDVVIIALAFGSQPSDLNWNPNADITDDGKITITDIVIAALQFGKVIYT